MIERFRAASVQILLALVLVVHLAVSIMARNWTDTYLGLAGKIPIGATVILGALACIGACGAVRELPSRGFLVVASVSLTIGSALDLWSLYRPQFELYAIQPGVDSSSPHWSHSLHHLVAGVFVTLVFAIAAQFAVRSSWIAALIAAALTCAGELCLELVEYRVFFQHVHYATTYYDTIADMGMSLAGAAIGAILAVILLRLLPIGRSRAAAAAVELSG